MYGYTLQNVQRFKFKLTFSPIKQHFKLLYFLLLSVCFQCLLASGSEGQDQTEPNEKLRKGNSAAFSSSLAYQE